MAIKSNQVKKEAEATSHLETIVTAQETSDGAGVKLHRSLGSYQLQTADPFLLLDEFKSDHPDDYIAGFPNHPHRGFETVTYMLAGKMEHKDNQGNAGVIRPGGVQWMTAGRGIIHSEMPVQENGLMWGFQLWVNLPGHQKMKAPWYQAIEPEEIPQIHPDGKTSIRVIAGESFGTEGVVKGVDIDPLFLDIHMQSQHRFSHRVQPTHRTLIYVFQGAVAINNGRENQLEIVSRGQLAALSRAESLSLKTLQSDVRLLVLSGKPIGEPIVKYGPFVMNTELEIKQAISDYQSGNFAVSMQKT